MLLQRKPKLKKQDLLIRIEKLEAELGGVQKRVAELERIQIVPQAPLAPMPDSWRTDRPKPYPYPLNGNLICTHCGNDSGWPKVLCMVIPPEGLRCQSCGEICIYGNTVTYSAPINKDSYESHAHPQIMFDPKPTEPIVTCQNENVLTNGTRFAQ